MGTTPDRIGGDVIDRHLRLGDGADEGAGDRPLEDAVQDLYAGAVA